MITMDYTSEETHKRLMWLRAPFPENQVSQLPKGTKAQNQCPAAEKRNCNVCGGWHHPKIRHLSYVGHAAVTDRLLDCDPSWYWEPLAYTPEGLPLFDASGGLWIKLTVCGFGRLGYGHARAKGGEDSDPGNREKEVIGDALRNAGMRFGMALDLWHKGDLHAHEEEQREEVKSADLRSNDHRVLIAEAMTKKAGQEQTPEELAMWLLAGFEEAKTLEDIEKTKALMQKEWERIRMVTGIKESIFVMVKNAKLRIKSDWLGSVLATNDPEP